MQRVVIIQGSASDTPYTDRIVRELSGTYRVERRIASAHRSPDHLQRVLDQYETEPTVFVTVAGLSDALSGTVAARFSGKVVACPPDAAQYGEAKRFSSTMLPGGNGVEYAPSPETVLPLVQGMFRGYDAPLSGRDAFFRKRDDIMRADAALQGAEDPLTHTLFRRGKTRDVYDVGDGTLLIRASDRVSAFDVVMPERIPGKGEALTDLSAYWFTLAKPGEQIPNHFLERADERTIRVRKAERIDVEWVIRGYLYGSLARAYHKGERELYGLRLPDGLELAQELPEPILTATTKADVGHDQPLTKEEAVGKGLVADSEEWYRLAGMTRELYRFYRRSAMGEGIIIPDFKLEFGRLSGDYLQIDEPPTHDSARFWDRSLWRPGQKQEGHALDKEFLRQYLLQTGYRGEGEPPHLPGLVVDQISRRCRGAADVLMGRATMGSLGLLSVDEVLQQLGKQ